MDSESVIAQTAKMQEKSSTHKMSFKNKKG